VASLDGGTVRPWSILLPLLAAWSYRNIHDALGILHMLMLVCFPSARVSPPLMAMALMRGTCDGERLADFRAWAAPTDLRAAAALTSAPLLWRGRACNPLAREAPREAARARSQRRIPALTSPMHAARRA
jgi:hypothetical protein